MRCISWIAVVVVAISAFEHKTPAAERGKNLVQFGDFELPGLQFSGPRDAPGGWRRTIPRDVDASITQVAGEGRNGSRCLKYTKTDAESKSIHADQILQVERGAVYEVSAWVRGDGELKPLVCITDLKYKEMAKAKAEPGTQWTELRFMFQPRDQDLVRLEWFGGADGKINRGLAGESYLDDVCVRKIDSPGLRMAMAVQQPRSREEIDPRSMRAGPVGKPAPLRAITCKDGVLRYADGTEVALWGVNFQTPLSWEYQNRLKDRGVPLEAEALKTISSENLDQVRQMDGSVIRMHLLPIDFTDADGGLKDTIFLDVLDHLLAQCRQKQIYVYLTLVNEMKTSSAGDSFLAGRDRQEWITDSALVEKTSRYIRALLEHENRYSKVKYKDDPTIALFEIANEPQYVDYPAMQSEEMFKPLRENFARWCSTRQIAEYPEVLYYAWRYEYVRNYINRMCEVIRGTGSKKPIAWNLNWPKKIKGHEDVFQAAADSTADAISFCFYPGQSDVPTPYWDNPTDLSGRNYLPVVREQYVQYELLRWALGQRFAKKAKLVYEFETFFNQSSYLYPAMARLFRALGVQMAQMWTYALSPAADKLGGSHYLNLQCTPQKALSFMIAADVFTSTPRLAPYDFESPDSLILGTCAISFEKNVSILQNRQTYMQTRPTEWKPFAAQGMVRRIAACGTCPLVTYDGTGVYVLEVGDRGLDIVIHPDATFVQPHWRRARSGVVCSLEPHQSHPMTLKLPGWGKDSLVWRVEGDARQSVAITGGSLTFDARAGRYRVERPR